MLPTITEVYKPAARRRSRLVIAFMALVSYVLVFREVEVPVRRCGSLEGCTSFPAVVLPCLRGHVRRVDAPQSQLVLGPDCNTGAPRYQRPGFPPMPTAFIRRCERTTASGQAERLVYVFPSTPGLTAAGGGDFHW